MAGKALAAFALFNAFDGASAFWRMECRGRAGLSRIDPIMDFSVPSTHVHSIHGSSGKLKDAIDCSFGALLSCSRFHFRIRMLLGLGLIVFLI